MNIIEIHKKFNTTNKCLEYMEKLRWGVHPYCTKCGTTNVVSIKNDIGRYHCNECKTTFSVLSNTIFEESKLPLPKWFVIIGLVLNAKKGISAMEIMRNVDITYKTAWYIAMRMRCAMLDNCNMELSNIVEMDEAYMGGKPKKRYSDRENEPTLSKVTLKRGRGTKKTPVVGVVERKGKVVLKVIEKLTSKNLLAMLRENVNVDDAIVVTDEFKSYNKFDEVVQHYTVNHGKKEYVRGMMHTNTIEGFWSIVKNSIKGNYIAISKKYLPLYMLQAQYIYNNRENSNLFNDFMRDALMHDKPMLNYKPIRDAKTIAYKSCGK